MGGFRNLLNGDTLSGCWATIGVLIEKGNPRTSSTGKPYAIWKFGCLNEKTASLFLFGDAYQRNCNEKAGTVFALFNSSVRKDSLVLFPSTFSPFCSMYWEILNITADLLNLPFRKMVSPWVFILLVIF